MPLLTELDNHFSALSYKYAAPTALIGTVKLSRVGPYLSNPLWQDAKEKLNIWKIKLLSLKLFNRILSRS